jgi:hypothetical protein
MRGNSPQCENFFATHNHTVRTASNSKDQNHDIMTSSGGVPRRGRGCGAMPVIFYALSIPTPKSIPIEEQRLIKPTHDTNPTQASDAPSLTLMPKMASICSTNTTCCGQYGTARHHHDIICITLPGQEAKVLLSQEGITQGGVMGLTIYGILTMQLAE